jgi:hypothetical protein
VTSANAEGTPREVDLRGIDMAQLLPQAEAAIQAAKAGEAITLLADNEVVVKYVTPTAATSGVRCRFGPPRDGVWRIDLSPRG